MVKVVYSVEAQSQALIVAWQIWDKFHHQCLNYDDEEVEDQQRLTQDDDEVEVQ